MQVSSDIEIPDSHSNPESFAEALLPQQKAKQANKPAAICVFLIVAL